MLSSMLSYLSSVFKSPTSPDQYLATKWKPAQIHISRYTITLHRALREDHQYSITQVITEQFNDLCNTPDYPLNTTVIDKAIDMLYNQCIEEGYKGYIVIEDIPHGKKIYLREQ